MTSKATKSPNTKVTTVTNNTGGAISEETIMRQRLLFDGDGTGDDRRLKVCPYFSSTLTKMSTFGSNLQELLKSIIKFSNSPSEDASETDIKKEYEKIINQIESVEFIDQKNKIIQSMNQVS